MPLLEVLSKKVQDAKFPYDMIHFIIFKSFQRRPIGVNNAIQKACTAISANKDRQTCCRDWISLPALSKLISKSRMHLQAILDNFDANFAILDMESANGVGTSTIGLSYLS
jgi:hypothetical protein